RGIAEEFTRGRGRELLDADHVVVLAGGTGSPFFSTDTGAALRAAELGCGTILKATKVDGVYDADPKSNPDAQRFDRLTIDEAIRRELRVLDLSALDMCRAHGIDVIVFDFAVGGAAARAIRGEAVGTRIETA
ncbi:MAG: UMP kinase, partial [Planctomycetota bacterium]